MDVPGCLDKRRKRPQSEMWRAPAGFSLIELMATLLLLGIALAVLGAALRRSGAIFTSARGEYGRVYAALRLKNLLRTVCNDLDSHRLALLPRIHSEGITFADGSPNTAAYGRNFWKPGTSALSSVRLDIVQTFDIRRTAALERGFNIYACPRYQTSVSLQGIDSYAGLSVDGLVELSGRAEAAGRQRCRNFSLAVSPRSMLSGSSQNIDPETLLLLIPISENYSLYLDLNGRLRYVQHRGAESIENQPLLGGLEELTFAIKPLPSAFLLLAQARSDGKPVTAGAANRFGRRPSYNLLFHRS